MIHLLRFLTAMSLFLAIFTAEAAVATYEGKAYLTEPQLVHSTPAQTVCVAAFRLYGLTHGLEYVTISASSPEQEEVGNHNEHRMSVVGITNTSGMIERECKTTLIPQKSGKMIGTVWIHLDGVMYDMYDFGFMEDINAAVVRQH